MVSLAIETATAGFGALVFCGSRVACQMNAQLISEAMPSPSTLDPELLERRLDLLAELGSLPCGLDPVFQNTIIKGVAFHRKQTLDTITIPLLTVCTRRWIDYRRA